MKYIEIFRLQKIYKPTIVKRMINSENVWWSDSDDARKDIIKYLDVLAPEATEKEKRVNDGSDSSRVL